MNVTLHVATGEGAGQDIPISGARFVIGRALDCDLRANCPWVSRYHCELIMSENCIVVRNTDDRHDTFVNGERLDGKRKLKSGDRLGVGQNLFDVRFS